MGTVFSSTALKGVKLNIGTIYLYAGAKTEGQCRAGVYLGKNTYNKFMFYNVGGLLLATNKQTGQRVVLHEDIEIKNLVLKAKEILQGAMTNIALTEILTKPTIFGVVPFYTESELLKLFAKKKLLGIPSIELNIHNDIKDGYSPLKPSEMVVGNVYVGREDLGTKNEGYRNAYVYVGKQSNKKYKYIFIGRLDTIKTNLDLWTALENYVSNQYIQGVIEGGFKKLYRPIYWKEVNQLNCAYSLQSHGYIK